MSMDWISSRGQPSKHQLIGTAPLTDQDSKEVMLRAERHDEIRFTDIVQQFSSAARIPDRATVLRRINTYYGPSLILHDEDRGQELNYQLTAPGPDTYLYLWGAETDDGGFRTTWFKLAEMKAEFAQAQPQYDICGYCGEPIRTLEHERAVAFGQCSM